MVKVSHFKWKDSEGYGVKIEMGHGGVNYSMNILLDDSEQIARTTAGQLQTRFDLTEQAEREACARIADDHAQPFVHSERESCAKEIALSIRARSNPKSESIIA